jgi:NAD+ kinase
MQAKFKRIGLWGRLTDAKLADPALEISRHLTAQGLEVYTAGPLGGESRLPGVRAVPESELGANVDLLLAVGGDGNLLRAARCVAGFDVPLIGINRGRLGFLTDVSPDQMLDAIDAILAGRYLAEERLMLQAVLRSDETEGAPMFALNDVVMQKGDSGRILDFITTVDGSYVNTHGGDGLIVATATGSTAYALSCGGPIIQPNVAAFVMVPICPHTLSDRPLVMPSSSVVEVELEPESGSESPVYVSCDGEELGPMDAAQTLEIRLANKTVTLLHPTDYNYYELLRSKLNWGSHNRSNH